jgi:transcriptional regulator with XRE-family HTH domain
MQTGAKQLADWMRRRTLNQRETAAHFGWDETFISQLVTGKRTPGLANALKIERETGIPVEAWMASDADISEPALIDRAGKRKHDKA